MRTGRVILLLMVAGLMWASQTASVAAGDRLLAADKPVVESPRSGEALQGVVTVIGTTDIAGFQSAETEFSYDEDGAVWFVLEQSKVAVKSDQLARWDTTTITDGQYRLRVRVHLADGGVSETVVTGLRVRNYSAVETPLPATELGKGTATAPALENGPAPQNTATTLPSVTPRPVNPAEVTPLDLVHSGMQGVAIILLGFVVLGGYTGFRAFLHRAGRRR
jgi:hypothetical protein